MKARCPLCGTRALARGDGWDGDTLRVRGHEVRLTPNESDLLRVLARAEGRWVTKESIVTGVWGAIEPDTAEASVAVYVSRLRRKLAGTGIAIGSSARGRGCRTMYRIEAGDEP